MNKGYLPGEDWLKVGSGEMTGFMVDYKIPGTALTITYDAGDKFWNMREDDKRVKAVADVKKFAALLE